LGLRGIAAFAPTQGKRFHLESQLQGACLAHGGALKTVACHCSVLWRQDSIVSAPPRFQKQLGPCLEEGNEAD